MLPDELEDPQTNIIIIRDTSPEPPKSPISIHLSPSPPPELPQDPASPQSHAQTDSDTESVMVTRVTQHTNPVTQQSKREHKIYQAIIMVIHNLEPTNLEGITPQDDEASTYWYYAKYHKGQGYKNIAQSLLNYMKLGKKLREQKDELI